MVKADAVFFAKWIYRDNASIAFLPSALVVPDLKEAL